MNKPNVTITAPQLGVNDEEAELIEWLVDEGCKISAGETLCVLETTKATYEIESEISGYVVQLVKEHEVIALNQEIAVIVLSKEEVQTTKDAVILKNNKITSDKIGDIKATKKAIKLAKEHGIELSNITPDKGEIIRESHVLSYLDKQKKQFVPELIVDIGSEYIPVALYGAGNGAITLQEAMEAGDQYRAVCFIDDNPKHAAIHNGLPIVHGSQLSELKEKGIDHIATEIAGGAIRMRIKKQIENFGFELVTIIHPSAFIATSVKIGIGNFIKARAVIETNTVIRDCCIIDNGVVIAHDNLIENACHIAPGAIFGSSIKIGENTIVGIGASISTNINIGSNCIISVGSAVTKHVENNSVVDGVPAKVIGKTK
jgi:sugar O-acyltransferase (sialic acid O-acetyltransferase NeuD family)